MLPRLLEQEQFKEIIVQTLDNKGIFLACDAKISVLYELVSRDASSPVPFHIQQIRGGTGQRCAVLLGI